jgi:hypothetical protein
MSNYIFLTYFCMFISNMLTYNLLETIHSIRLWLFEKRGSYLNTVTFDGYVQSFKHNALYKEYLKGGTSKQGLNRNELHLHIMSASSNPLQMVIVVTNYVSTFSFTLKMPHFEGKNVFESCKWCTNLPSKLEGNSHKNDYVNFSHSWIETSHQH